MNRNAWRMSSVPLASSYRIKPGKIASPAASADVHPSGRRSSVERSKIAPDPASHRPRAAFQYVWYVSKSMPAITIDDQHVVIAVGAAADVTALDVVRRRLGFWRNRIAGDAANPESLSPPYSTNVTGTRACVSRNDHVRKAVGRRSEIRVQTPHWRRTAVRPLM